MSTVAIVVCGSTLSRGMAVAIAGLIASEGYFVYEGETFELKAPKLIEYDCEPEIYFKRDRDYPTLREGMRRKQINKIRR